MIAARRAIGARRTRRPRPPAPRRGDGARRSSARRAGLTDRGGTQPDRHGRSTDRRLPTVVKSLCMDETSIDVNASPEHVWSLITDVTQMGRWSPECWSCTWLDGADGPVVGARFKGRNKRGLMRWSTISTVVVADQPNHFAFEVDNSGMRWGLSPRRRRCHDAGERVPREGRSAAVVGPCRVRHEAVGS